MKIFAILSVLIAFCVPSFAQIKSEQDAASIITQVRRSVRGDSVHLSSNKAAPNHANRAVASFKGAAVVAPGHSGFLAVHLVGDPAGFWYKMFLDSAAGPVGAEYDSVADSTKGTTVHFDTTLYLIPYLYKSN